MTLRALEKDHGWNVENYQGDQSGYERPMGQLLQYLRQEMTVTCTKVVLAEMEKSGCI